MPKFLDRTGIHYGEWEAKEYLGSGRWLCKCSCGVEKAVYGRDLTRGTSTSCGHLRKVNIENQKFGEWLVLKQIDYQYALCECTLCHNKYEVRISNLKSGSSTKCVECCRRKNAESVSEKLLDNLKGKQFHNWLVLEYKENGYWLCECQCSNHTKKIVYGGDLRRGKTKSCGCSVLRDLTLENTDTQVIEYVGGSYWKCKCKYCGKEYIASRVTILNGTDNCGCETVKRRNASMLAKYGDRSHSRINNPRQLWQQKVVETKEDFEKFIRGLLPEESTVHNIAYQLDLSDDRILKLTHKYGLEHLVSIRAGSGGEDDLYRYITEELGQRAIKSDRSIIAPQELDIYIPDKKIAIEYNGTYWHSDVFKGKTYHQDKTLICAKRNIRLIHIFEYEWLSNKDKLKAFLRNAIIGSKEVVYGRNCEVQIITTDEAKEFLNINHLQGYTRSGIQIGLKQNDKLLGIMTFGSPRFAQDFQYELIRFCWRTDITVVGGMEKMFKYFTDNFNPQSIISYCDLSKFTGNSYTKLGFKIQQNCITSPGYVWVNAKHNDVIPRYKSTKKMLVKLNLGTEEQTEDEIMKNIGFMKVYNSGNLKLAWIKEE